MAEEDNSSVLEFEEHFVWLFSQVSKHDSSRALNDWNHFQGLLEGLRSATNEARETAANNDQRRRKLDEEWKAFETRVSTADQLTAINDAVSGSRCDTHALGADLLARLDGQVSRHDKAQGLLRAIEASLDQDSPLCSRVQSLPDTTEVRRMLQEWLEDVATTSDLRELHDLFQHRVESLATGEDLRRVGQSVTSGAQELAHARLAVEALPGLIREVAYDTAAAEAFIGQAIDALPKIADLEAVNRGLEALPEQVRDIVASGTVGLATSQDVSALKEADDSFGLAMQAVHDTVRQLGDRHSSEATDAKVALEAIRSTSKDGHKRLHKAVTDLKGLLSDERLGRIVAGSLPDMAPLLAKSNNATDLIQKIRHTLTTELSGKDREFKNLVATLANTKIEAATSLERVESLEMAASQREAYIAELKTKSESLEMAASRREARIDELKTKSALSHREAKDRISGLYANVESSSARILELETSAESHASQAEDMAVLRKSLGEAEHTAANFKRELALSEARTEATDQLMADFRQQVLSGLTLHTDAGHAAGERDRLRVEVSELSDKLADAGHVAGERDRLRSEVSELSDKLADKSDSLSRSNAKLEEAEGQVSILTARTDQLQLETESSLQQVRALEQEHQTHEGEMATLQKQLADANDTSAKTQRQLSELEQRLTKANATEASTHGQLDDALRKVTDLEQSVAVAETSRDDALASATDLESRLKAANSAETNARTQLGNALRQVTAAEGKLSDAYGEATRARRMADDAGRKADHAERQRGQLDDALRETRRQLHEYSQKCDDLEAELGHARAVTASQTSQGFPLSSSQGSLGSNKRPRSSSVSEQSSGHLYETFTMLADAAAQLPDVPQRQSGTEEVAAQLVRILLSSRFRNNLTSFFRDCPESRIGQTHCLGDVCRHGLASSAHVICPKHGMRCTMVKVILDQRQRKLEYVVP